MRETHALEEKWVDAVAFALSLRTFDPVRYVPTGI